MLYKSKEATNARKRKYCRTHPEYRAKKAKSARVWYKENKVLVVERNRTIRQSNRRFLVIYKILVGCCECGTKDARILDFHHVDPKKKSICLGHVGRNYSLKKIIEELRKCKIMCSNCHRIVEFNKREVA